MISTKAVLASTPAVDPPATPLAELPAGAHGLVLHLTAGRGLLGQMATLGLTPGTPVTMIQNYGRGPLIVRVRGARIALGRGQAQCIQVRRGAE